MWEKINHYVTIGYNKIFGVFLSYPEFQFLGKIVLGIIALAVLVLLFKLLFTPQPEVVATPTPFSF